MVSVIIPVYNDEKRLRRCLESVFSSDCGDFEVIVVNDGSTDNSLKVCEGFPCRVIDLKTNSGVANARNAGANAARGEILVFFDSDIVVERNTISNFKKLHLKPGVMISSCQVFPRSLSKGFSSDLLALDWRYVYKLLEKKASYIPTMNFAINKKVFDELGQFNAAFSSSGGEEIEIGMQALQKGYKINVDQSFCVHHHFQSFWPRCKTLFRRGYVYGIIVLQRGLTFDDGHGTPIEGISAGLSVLGLLFLAAYPFLRYSGLLFILTVISQVFLNIRLNLFIIKNRGVMFFIASIPLYYAWYLVMGLSILRAITAYFIQRVILRRKSVNFVRRSD